MKKLLMTLALATTAFVASQASADHRDRRPPFPGHGAPRFITVWGQGSGGTERGNRAGACEKAQVRARFDVAQACANLRGYLRDSFNQSCDCDRKRGSRDDYVCRVNARGTCEIGGRRF